jgi:hypothetical protein
VVVVIAHPSSLSSGKAGKFNNVEVAAPLLHLEAAEVAAGETDDDLLKRITR